MLHKYAPELPGPKVLANDNHRRSTADVAKEVERASENARQIDKRLKQMFRATRKIPKTPKRKRIGE